MTTRFQQRRARLRAEYGFDFPDDFYQFWEFVNRLSPLDPLNALNDLDLVLVGPFEILSGRFDGRVPKHSLLLHWRYHDDPPEFFTVLAGGGDGLHFGYFFDNPDEGSACVASYYAHDAYEISTEGNSLFEAVRLYVEFMQADLDLDEDYELMEEAEHEAGTEILAHVRLKLMERATAERAETGEAYTERYAGLSARNDRVIAETWEGMGIVADKALYRPLSLTGRELWRAVRRRKTDLSGLIAEAKRALADGFPATALELGKNLWATGDLAKFEAAYELLDAAYVALGRESLARVLQTHRANRRLHSVDVLDDET